MAYGTPGVHTHQEWLGLVQPVGLVVAPVVLSRLGLFPESQPRTLADGQRRLLDLLEEVETPGGEIVSAVGRFEDLATELLSWEPGDLIPAESFTEPIEVALEEYGDVLRPSHGLPAPGQEGKLQALVQELPAGTALDEPLRGTGWEATPEQRFERLLKESEHPIGLLFNGVALRLVYAPRGESSGHITFPLEPMATVAGRPLLGALQLLLGVDRLLAGSSDQRLPVLLAASRKEQNEVSTRLAEQVLEALWELLLGFDQAERIARDAGRTVLGALPAEQPEHVYGGLITVLLRLVFLLYAEDEDLMPPDSLYGQHYSVSGLADRLRSERDEHQGAMESRRGAWASLLSLFRLVYDGGGADPAYLPARHGELFDPDAYPFLEGREQGSHYADGILDQLPALSDDVVEKVLSKLIWLEGERLSYRALDVEQIGSVYEGIMGFGVEQAGGPSVGITYRPPRQKITITVVVDAEQLLTQQGSKREKWLDEQAGVALKLPTKVKQELKGASSLAELCTALDKKLSPHTPRGLAAGSLILQPTAERRRSGSHYTPRALTEPIVKEAFRPWLERFGGQPTAEQVLDLKVCDPAMGSGAFLVATCRYLAGHLVAAWEDPEGSGFPPEFEPTWDKDIYARRLVAQRCLYGVDKNPFAVNLAKLSLWLVTLSKELPFTFVDHALKCGDSLVGVSRREIEAALKGATQQRDLWEGKLQDWRQQEQQRFALFHADSRNDADDARKRKALRQQQASTAFLRSTGDLLVAAFFNGSKPKDRQELRDLYLAATVTAPDAAALEAELAKPLERLRQGEKGITPLHWVLEFPDVFGRDDPGFDVFVGNPPFGGITTIASTTRHDIAFWLKNLHTGISGQCDLSGHFFRRAWTQVRSSGSISLIATNTISEGDTRESSIGYICKEGGTIYSVIKRLRWPGQASVIVSVLQICKQGHALAKILDGIRVEKISSFLLTDGGDEKPKQLASNAGTCFKGCELYGQGFLFSEQGYTDEDEVGVPSPPSVMAKIGEDSPAELLFIKNYIGGEDVNGSPSLASPRKVIDFGNSDLEEIVAKAPRLLDIVDKKVRPERATKAADVAKYPWWKHWRVRQEMRLAIANCSQVLVACIHQHFWQITPIRNDSIFANSLMVFALSELAWFNLLQSNAHTVWMMWLGSSLKDDLRYTAADCFETFPFPVALLDSTDPDPALTLERHTLEATGNRYHQFRTELMLANNEGLTSTYNRFHDPGEASSGILELRRLHGEMDQEVLNAYGWSDLPTACGFGLDHLDLDDDIQLPEELQDRIDIGDLFFWESDEACAFQGQLQAITGSRRKLPWRYRWPDAVRDEVLARLLALNAERSAEEQAQGGQGGGRGPRRPSRPKPTASRSVEPFSMPGEVQVDLFKPPTEQLELGR